jgi:hypothetical protein
MKFLFATLQHIESDFYGRVGQELGTRGHDVSHLTYSRRAAKVLRRRGVDAYCLPDLMKDELAVPWRELEAEIVGEHRITSLGDVYRTDPAYRRGDSPERCAERTVQQFVAVRRLFERLRPELVVPEVGSESMRTVVHLVGTARGATTLFLMYTLFDDPLRLYAGTLDAPIVSPDELRPLSRDEAAELDEFIARYRRRNQPIREYRAASLSRGRPRAAARHFAVKALWDRDNVYLTPAAWLARDLRARARVSHAQRIYSPDLPSGEYVYFPLQVADDYKLIRLRPECADQEAIVERIVEALPPGVHLVVKEHPMSIGRNPVDMLRRMASHPRAHLVEPHTSTLELIERSAGVVTISSTVGLEALMYERPVMTLGRPFYAGYGGTLDVDWPEPLSDAIWGLGDFRPDRELVRRFLHAAKRRCYPGAPVLVDDSDENALRLATTLDRAARGELDVSRPPVQGD